MKRQTINLVSGDFSCLSWVSGKDKPLIHWAHATGFNGQTYAPLLSELAKDFNIYAWDARGHGHSTATACPQDLHDWYIYRDDLVLLLEDLSQRHGGQKLILGGHSMGGCVSIMAAAARPDLVDGLVLVDPVIISHVARLMLKINRFLGIKKHGLLMAERARKRQTIWPDMATIKKVYTGRGAFINWQSTFLDAYLEGGTRPYPQGVALTCSGAWEAATFSAQNHNAIAAVKNLQHPFKLLMAETQSTTRAVHVFKKQKLPKTIETIAGSDHFIPMRYPEIVRHAFYDLALWLD